MDQFTVTKSVVGTGGVIIITSSSKLPNGNKHGLNTTNAFDGDLDSFKKKFFKNGKLLAK